MHKSNRIRIFFCCFLLVIGCCMYQLGYQFMTKDMANPKEEIIASDGTDKELPATVKQKKVESKEAVKSANPLSSFSYAVIAEEGYLTVYESDLKTVYLYTCIPVDSLPNSLQKEIEKGKLFADEQELYTFLETYSS